MSGVMHPHGVLLPDHTWRRCPFLGCGAPAGHEGAHVPERVPPVPLAYVEPDGQGGEREPSGAAPLLGVQLGGHPPGLVVDGIVVERSSPHGEDLAVAREPLGAQVVGAAAARARRALEGAEPERLHVDHVASVGPPAHDGNPTPAGLAPVAGHELDIGAETAPRPIVDQPPPAPSTGPAIWELVIADMLERDRLGRERYGTPLRAFNGRDAKVDAYQEILDAAVYLRQDIEQDRELRAAAAEALAVADAVAHVVVTDGCVLPELCARAEAARERLRSALARLPAPSPTSEAP